jgi:putative thiamine transport system permease protein
LLSALSFVLVLTWSVSNVWPFPKIVPKGLSLDTWTTHAHEVGAALLDTILVGAMATLIAVAVVIGCLESEFYRGLKSTRARIYIPLVVPQIAFLFGLQVVLIVLDRDGTRAAVIAAHLVFVLPYVFLTLGDLYRSLDPRYGRVAAALGAGPWRVFWRIRLPLLARGIVTSAAVGFAVSVSQYLATLLPGAGRVETVTTAAVAVFAGGDRRLTAVYAAAQMLLPLLPFAAALMTSRSKR